MSTEPTPTEVPTSTAAPLAAVPPEAEQAVREQQERIRNSVATDAGNEPAPAPPAETPGDEPELAAPAPAEEAPAPEPVAAPPAPPAPAVDNGSSIVVAGVECVFPPFKDLTLGEKGEIEHYFDKPLSEIGPHFASIRGGIMAAYIARRRVDPSWTLAMTEALGDDDVVQKGSPKRPTEAPSSTGTRG